MKLLIKSMLAGFSTIIVHFLFNFMGTILLTITEVIQIGFIGALLSISMGIVFVTIWEYV